MSALSQTCSIAKQGTEKSKVNATMETNMNTDSCITITTKFVNDADGEGMDKSEKIDETDEQLEEQSSLMKVEDSDVSFDKDEDIILSIAGGEERKNTDCKPVDVVESTDKKDKKKRKKKKGKTANKPTEEVLLDKHAVEMKKRKNTKLTPIPKPQPKQDMTKHTVQTVSNVCCFGFIGSWWAKKKEKRRVKKRQAIRARFSTSLMNKLKAYEHKKSRGGEAFSLELDDRPIKKPLLPPIKMNTGPIKLNYEQKMQKAEKKRQEELLKRKEFFRAQEERRLENAERKADNERGFKQKAALTIVAKQGQAKRNQSRLEMDKRCASSMNRVTSVLPRDHDDLNSIKFLD